VIDSVLEDASLLVGMSATLSHHCPASAGAGITVQASALALGSPPDMHHEAHQEKNEEKDKQNFGHACERDGHAAESEEGCHERDHKD
jgi:hypothetical protein